jgi:hypothetical protein
MSELRRALEPLANLGKGNRKTETRFVPLRKFTIELSSQYKCCFFCRLSFALWLNFVEERCHIPYIAVGWMALGSLPASVPPWVKNCL